MRTLKMSSILSLAVLLTVNLWGPTLSYAQQSSEQFIPIGMSPGISNKYSYIGNITAVNKPTNTFTMQSSNGEKKIIISPSTRIWFDRSKVRKTNVEANFDDCKVGSTVEVMHSHEDENITDWVKIESSQ